MKSPFQLQQMVNIYVRLVTDNLVFTNRGEVLVAISSHHVTAYGNKHITQK